MTLEILLPPDPEESVQRRIASGRYASASEVIGEALRLLERVETSRTAAAGTLRDDLGQGLADREAGRMRDFSPEALNAEARARALAELVEPGNKKGI